MVEQVDDLADPGDEHPTRDVAEVCSGHGLDGRAVLVGLDAVDEVQYQLVLVDAMFETPHDTVHPVLRHGLVQLGRLRRGHLVESVPERVQCLVTLLHAIPPETMTFRLVVGQEVFH